MQNQELVVQYVDPNSLTVFEYSRELFPRLEGDAYEMLKKDIETNGIRTPLEITKENLILCGNERHRIALELKLTKVPVTYFGDTNIADQKIRCIKDNLARKNVNKETKWRCYFELKILYGLKQRENMKEYPRDNKGHIRKPVASEEGTGKLSLDIIAKEVGFSPETMRRAGTIEESDLPKTIKEAAFDGRLSIRPVSELAREEEKVKDVVVVEAVKRLEAGEDGFSVETMIRDTKEELHMQKALEEIGAPSVDKQIDDFYKKISPSSSVPTKNSKPKHEDMIKSVEAMLEASHLKCKICGETQIRWKCGHDFN